jgi:hypothetical protein
MNAVENTITHVSAHANATSCRSIVMVAKRNPA